MYRLNLIHLPLLVLAVFFSLTVQAQGVRISATPGTPAPSSLLELQSSSLGFLTPRMTTAERNAIASPADGLLIYNTDEKCLNLYAGTMWKSMCGCDLPALVTGVAGSTSTATTLTIQWNAAANATGYLVDVSLSPAFNAYVNGYQGFAAGNVTSLTLTGLSAQTLYYFRVRGANACGNGLQGGAASFSTTAVPPFTCGSSTVSISHAPGDGVSPVTIGITYQTVSYVGRCWMDRNLGATQLPASALDALDAPAGWYWQFNRAQGYATGPNPNTWNTTGAGAGNWSASNDPCTLLAGSSWRIPTASEWASANTGWAGYPSAFSSPLKLHAAGNLLLVSNGSLNNRAYSGRYWSSTEYNATLGQNLHIGSNASQVENTNDKAHGFSIRCIRIP